MVKLTVHAVLFIIGEWKTLQSKVDLKGWVLGFEDEEKREEVNYFPPLHFQPTRQTPLVNSEVGGANRATKGNVSSSSDFRKTSLARTESW